MAIPVETDDASSLRQGIPSWAGISFCLGLRSICRPSLSSSDQNQSRICNGHRVESWLIASGLGRWRVALGPFGACWLAHYD